MLYPVPSVVAGSLLEQQVMKTHKTSLQCLFVCQIMKKIYALAQIFILNEILSCVQLLNLIVTHQSKKLSVVLTTKYYLLRSEKKRGLSLNTLCQKRVGIQSLLNKQKNQNFSRTLFDIFYTFYQISSVCRNSLISEKTGKNFHQNLQKVGI